MDKLVHLQIPESTYHKLVRAAELTYRSVNEIVVQAIESSLPTAANWPPALANELGAMHLLNDSALWAATQPTFSAAQQQRLAQLNQQAGEQPLTPAEQTEQEALLTAYQSAVVRRAQALAILKQRGFEITPHTAP